MGKHIGYGVQVGYFDEIGVRVYAVIEAVEVEEKHRLCPVVFEFGQFACACVGWGIPEVKSVF
jgi:hypothetical protein